MGVSWQCTNSERSNECIIHIIDFTMITMKIIWSVFFINFNLYT